MNSNAQGKPQEGKKDEEGMLEKIAKKIDPPGTDVSDEEIMDPGSNIRDYPPKENPTDRKPSQPR